MDKALDYRELDAINRDRLPAPPMRVVCLVSMQSHEAPSFMITPQ
jgi:hypothetical protein